MDINQGVKYSGPYAGIASITGSPLWGKSTMDVVNMWRSRGWSLVNMSRPETIYGIGPEVYHFRTADERSVLWIPSYGMELGKDWKHSADQLKLFWILWQAGVKVLLVGGTSGVAEWRSGDNIIRPGDIVLPTDFRTDSVHRGLPGTMYEMAWPKFDLLLDDPFCVEMAGVLERMCGGYVDRGLIGRVHTPRDVRVALVQPDGITFETTFDIEMWMVIAKQISEMRDSLPPRVTLHGDCINPVLARLLGIHVAYYHMVANWAQGVRSDEDIAETLYGLYLGNFAEVALELEFTFLSTAVIPHGDLCRCYSSLHTAPEVFSEAMTGGSQ